MMIWSPLRGNSEQPHGAVAELRSAAKARRLDESFLNQLAGNTAESDTKRTGLQSATAPDSDHIKRKNDQATDQALTTSDTFTIDLIDSGVERARTLEPGIRPIKQMGGEYFVVFLHPHQVTDLRQSTTTGQWLDIQKAAMQGGMVERNPIFTGALA